MLMSILAFFLVGLVVGFIASKFVNLGNDEPIVGMLCAIGGAFAGGVIFNLTSGRGFVAWDFYAILAAAVGASVAVGGYHLIRSRTISQKNLTVRRSY